MMSHTNTILGCFIALLAAPGCGQGSGGTRPEPDELDLAPPAQIATTEQDLAAPGSVVELQVGGDATCVLRADRQIVCWGYNGNGSLGLGDPDIVFVGDDETPADVGPVPVGAPVRQLVPGGEHTCAVFFDGKVKCWGSNLSGQLGYGDVVDRGLDAPVASLGFVDVGGPVRQLAAGAESTCARLVDGRVKCWGNGQFATLGYGNTNNVGDDETPAQVGSVQVGAPVLQLVAGNGHYCALLSDRSVKCWGQDAFGVLGYGRGRNDIGDNETPAAVGAVELGRPVQQLVAGAFHNCALFFDGTVKCWGANSSGELGYGTVSDAIGDDETPAAVGSVAIGAPVKQLAAGFDHTCALLFDGGVKCWGVNFSGQLGYGNTRTIGDDETPAAVGLVDVGGKVAQIAAGPSRTCALLRTGEVKCWGFNFSGQLGYGNKRTIGDDETPASVGFVDLPD